MRFSWAKKIHEAIVEKSKVTPRDVYCLWNPGNMKMIEEVMKNSKSPLCVMQCPSPLVKKNINKSKMLSCSDRFRLVEKDSCKEALNNLTSFIPTLPIPEKIIMLSLRMEIGAFWHVCLRSFLLNHAIFNAHKQLPHQQTINNNNSRNVSSIDPPHHPPSQLPSTQWLHMYLLLTDHELETLPSPLPPSTHSNETLSKQLLRSIFNHQTIIKNRDGLSLVRFELNKDKLGVSRKVTNTSQENNKKRKEEMRSNAEKDKSVVNKKKGGMMDEVDKREWIDEKRMKECLEALMLLKHLETRGSSRLLPLLDSECTGVGVELIQRGGFSMVDRVRDLSWNGWLKVVQIATTHCNFEHSPLNAVLKDNRDGLKDIPDFYSRRTHSRRFQK